MLNYLTGLFEVGHGDHRQIRSMEGLRGLAVFLVFLVHYVTLVEPWLTNGTLTWSLASHLRGVGHAGVDLFFVLSGYLIYGTLIGKPRPLLPYFQRRIQRIYPTFLAVFALYLLLSWLFPQESKIPAGMDKAGAYLLANILLLPGLFPIEPMITVAWSLSYEAFYYLAIPALIGLLRMREWSGRARGGFFVVTAAVGFCLAAWGSDGHVRLLMFVAGILLYELLQVRTPRIDKLGFIAFIAGMLLVDQWATGPARFVVLFLSFLLLCHTAFRGDGLTARIFCWTPLRWLGNMSYSYYLIHGVALKTLFFFIAKVLPPGQLRIGLEFWSLLALALALALAFAVTLLPAGFLFAWVERPYSLATRRRS